MKSKFGNISISKKKVTIISLLQDFEQKKHFSLGMVVVQIQ